MTKVGEEQCAGADGVESPWGARCKAPGGPRIDVFRVWALHGDGIFSVDIGLILKCVRHVAVAGTRARSGRYGVGINSGQKPARNPCHRQRRFLISRRGIIVEGLQNGIARVSQLGR